MPGRKTAVYTPRWLYRFFAFLEQLPIPLWLLGFLVGFIGGLVLHLDAWRQGLLPVGEFNWYLATTTFLTIGYIVLWMFLDRQARIALNDFYHSRNIGPSELETIRANFISLSPWSANLAFLVGLLGSYFTFPVDVMNQPLLGQVLPILGVVNYFLLGGIGMMLLYRLLRQAFLIPRFFRQIDVNLFNPKPVYALSRYASSGSIAWLLINYMLLLSTSPDSLFTPSNVIAQILFVGGALIFFFAPLASINQRMRREKELLLSKIGEDQKIINAKLHTLVNTKSFAGHAELRNMVSALKEQREVLQKLPTWPWQTDTLRNVFTPLLIPITVYLIQRFLGGLFGF